jgi:hypothetical protein
VRAHGPAAKPPSCSCRVCGCQVAAQWQPQTRQLPAPASARCHTHTPSPRRRHQLVPPRARRAGSAAGAAARGLPAGAGAGASVRSHPAGAGAAALPGHQGAGAGAHGAAAGGGGGGGHWVEAALCAAPAYGRAARRSRAAQQRAASIVTACALRVRSGSGAAVSADSPNQPGPEQQPDRGGRRAVQPGAMAWPGGAGAGGVPPLARGGWALAAGCQALAQHPCQPPLILANSSPRRAPLPTPPAGHPAAPGAHDAAAAAAAQVQPPACAVRRRRQGARRAGAAAAGGRRVRIPGPGRRGPVRAACAGTAHGRQQLGLLLPGPLAQERRPRAVCGSITACIQACGSDGLATWLAGLSLLSWRRRF